MRLRDAAARTALRRLLDRLQGGRLELLEDSGARRFGPADADLRARVRVHDPRAYAWALRGSTGWGEGYLDGLWETDGLVELTRIAARNLPGLDSWRRRAHPVLGRLQRAAALVPRNTLAGARANIAAHYDLGNRLFEAFLDERLIYSCAYFPAADASLEEAQVAKLERICARLALGPDDHLLEIGTGWGGLAIWAATEHGCRVTTTTISREQRDHARRLVSEAGLSDRVTVIDRDYRDLDGRFDKLVSIEMIEAVGWQYFEQFFACCGRLLRPGGLMFLQAIVIGDDVYEQEKALRTFTNKHVFPGGCLPSQGLIVDLAAKLTNLRPAWFEDISAHYARTLMLWRRRFNGAWDDLRGLGYDERFRRLWNFYLATSEGGFRERRIRDVQMLLADTREAAAADRRRRSRAVAQAAAA